MTICLQRNGEIIDYGKLWKIACGKERKHLPAARALARHFQSCRNRNAADLAERQGRGKVEEENVRIPSGIGRNSGINRKRACG